MRMRTSIGAGLLVTALACTGAPAAFAFGPQPMPDAACNAERVGYWAQGGYNTVPHWKDWDGDGVYACYHLNPLYPPGNPSLE
jgi:hypothetical protein